MSKMLRRFQRSASAPPTGARNNIGNPLAKPTMPSRNSERVNSYTSQLCATFWIHEPTNDRNAPTQYLRNTGERID
jgi:hypothetical protein